ncbi:MFS transporter [Bradyrhizobium sp.]|jgi:MFS family permease|uniref:MFS transporter n=1 Tax=Bradyrhizobium sp. TaxID=376 RepID=UPI003C1325C7
MVIAADSAEAAEAVGPSPSDASLRGLDGVNLLLAGALSGFGPYVAAFLAGQNWTQQSIGIVLTAGAIAGLLSQLPGGALLDVIRSKRAAVALGAVMVAAGALIIAVWPAFPVVLAALVLQGITGGFLGLAIVAISLGLVGNTALAARLGRNQRFASMGGVVAAGLMGLIAYFLSFRAIFFLAAALVLPLLVALDRIQPANIHFGRASCAPDHQGQGKPSKVRLRSLLKNRSLLVFAGCIFLFQMANASVLPLAGEALAYSKEARSSLIVAALIMVPQVIVAIIAPWAGRRANTWGRRPLLLVGFAALPIRALFFAWTSDPIILVVAQLLDGLSATMLGVLTALTVADLTAGTGRFNLAQGFVGTISGIGASLSTTLSGLLAERLGRAAGFLGIAAVALTAVLLLWLLMPETNPSNKNHLRTSMKDPLHGV